MISTAGDSIEAKDFSPDANPLSPTSHTSPKGVHYDLEAAIEGRREARGSADVGYPSIMWVWGNWACKWQKKTNLRLFSSLT